MLHTHTARPALSKRCTAVCTEIKCEIYVRTSSQWVYTAPILATKLDTTIHGVIFVKMGGHSNKNVQRLIYFVSDDRMSESRVIFVALLFERHLMFDVMAVWFLKTHFCDDVCVSLRISKGPLYDSSMSVITMT